MGDFPSISKGIDLLQNCDVLLLDINLPNISGIDGIKLLKEKYPALKIIMLTVLDDDTNIFKAIIAGADGYLLKKTLPVKILQAIEDVYNGGSPMTPTVAKQTLNLFRTFAPIDKTETDLTEREKEILNLLVDGFSNEEISNKLFISPLTAKNHIRHIYEKLHVHSRSQVVARAIKDNII
jgi:DNA-binding NarL/FixJ family response regulator